MKNTLLYSLRNKTLLICMLFAFAFVNDTYAQVVGSNRRVARRTARRTTRRNTYNFGVAPKLITAIPRSVDNTASA